jgi:hypothetical protein
MAQRESAEKRKKLDSKLRLAAAKDEDIDDEEEEAPPTTKTIPPIGAFQMPGSQSKLGEAEDEDLTFPQEEEEEQTNGIGPGNLPEALVVTSARVVIDYDDHREEAVPKKEVMLAQAEIMEEKTQEPVPAVNFQDKRVRAIMCCVLVGTIIFVVALSVFFAGGDSGGGDGDEMSSGNSSENETLMTLGPTVAPTFSPTATPTATPTMQPTSLGWFLQHTIRDGMDDEFGYSLELSGPGNHLVTGTRFGGKNRTGEVRLYARNEDTDEWQRRGPSIFGENNWDQLGYSVSVSDSGMYSIVLPYSFTFWHATILPHAFSLLLSCLFLSNNMPTGTTIAVGTLGRNYNVGGPDAGEEQPFTSTTRPAIYGLSWGVSCQGRLPPVRLEVMADTTLLYLGMANTSQL